MIVRKGIKEEAVVLFFSQLGMYLVSIKIQNKSKRYAFHIVSIEQNTGFKIIKASNWLRKE
jgi:hypothetical protein